jgi:zona occludens toxin (predicted ATPase)
MFPRFLYLIFSALIFSGWFILGFPVYAGQSIASGDVTGVVTDPAHSTIQDASVTPSPQFQAANLAGNGNAAEVDADEFRRI